MVSISIDAMSGDAGLAVTAPAVLNALKKHPDLEIIMVGDETLMTEAIGHKPNNLTFKHTTQVVEMDEAPASALRGKKDSSMRVAINLVKEETVDACVSAGNTGALMATGRFVLRMLEGVDRPAICAALPTIKSHSWMLDLGANVDSGAEHLLQFAIMGSALIRAVDNKESPSIGLLNVGEEEVKGNHVVKSAAALLNKANLNYYGFVEGDDIYKGTVDLIVSDGFVGNVALKSSEGVAMMIRHFLSFEFKRNLFRKISGVIAMPVLKSLKNRIDPRHYNGASLLGLNGVLVKSHGGTDAYGFEHAIMAAYHQVKNSLLDKIKREMDNMLHQEYDA